MRVLYKKQIFEQYKETSIDHGATLLDIVNAVEIPKEVHQYTQVRINGHLIINEAWHLVRPNKDTITSVAIVPADADSGTEILKTAVTIAVAYYTGNATSGISGAFLTAGATMATGLALNALFPPPNFNLTADPDRTSLNSITGQSNRPDPYGVVIKNYGRNRVYPRVVAEPYTYYVGNDQYLVGIYDFGLGKNTVAENLIRLGESNLVEFEGVEYNVASNPSELKIYKNKTNAENFTVLFEDLQDDAIRTSPENSESVELKFDFPQGLTTIVGAKRVKRTTIIGLNIKVKPQGSSTWTDFTNYNYEIDKNYEVDTVNYYDALFAPDTAYGTGTYTTKTGLLGTQKIYEKTRVIHNSNIVTISFKNEIVDSWENTFGSSIYTLRKRALKVGDSITNIPGTGGGYSVSGGLNARTPSFKILEIISSVRGSEDTVYTLKLNNVVSINTTTEDDYVTGVFPTNFKLGVKVVSYDDTLNIKENTTSPFRFNVKINFNRSDTWDVWVYWDKLTVEQTGSSPQYINDFHWSGIIGYTKSAPIITNDLHTYLELKIKATDQLSGQIDNLSCEITSVLPYYDTVSNTWKEKETNNPAWVFVDILTGNLNQRALSKDKLDIDSIVNWANYCETNKIIYQGNEVGFECNFVLDYSITVRELLTQVCSTGRATINIANGKYGVVIDQLRTTPVQIFNQRNVKSTKVSRVYNRVPDAVKAIYVDPFSNWQKNEVIAYDDGKNFSNSTVIEEMEMFAITNIAQAWRQGRYHLAQFKLRQNTVSIDVDFENLACSRGDLVLFSHDVMKIGGLPARVIAISGNNVTLDEPVSNQGGTYVLRSRIRATDKIKDLSVVSFVDTHTVQLSSVDSLQYDDLVVFGEADTVTRQYLVKSINYSGEYDASLELIEYAPEIYDADSGIIPDYFTITQGDPLAGGNYPNAVTNLSVEYNIDCNTSEKRYIYTATITWDAPTNNPVDNYEIYLTINGQQQLVGFTKNRSFIHTVSSLFINFEHSFKIIGVDGAGRKMPLQNAPSIEFTPTEDTVKPENISEFNANILSETIELDWRLVSDCDIDRYYIRYSPKTTGAIWGQSVALTSTGATQNSVQVPLRTGTYFIKAQDWAGNTSETAAFLKTQVPEILKIDFISNVVAPTWDGVYEKTELVGQKLKLKSTDDDVTYVDSFGNFYFREIFDLGSVFSARFTSKIVAGGYSGLSLMKNWDTLSLVDPIAGNFTEDDFDVAAYIRTRNEADLMVDWPTMASVDYLSFGSELTATPWQRFKSADFTGRLFQLKIQLEGNADQTVSPVVFDVEIEANWTDRVIDGRDIQSGVRVNFDGAFVNIPAIQITASENISTGDYYLITEKDETGFTVQFYNSSNNPISTPKFDWVAKGYGKKYTLEDINF